MKILFKKIGLFFLFLYFVTILIFSYDINLNRISHITFLIFCFFAVTYIAIKRKIEFSPFYIFIYLFLIQAIASYFWAINKDLVLSTNRTFVQIAILAFILINFLDDKDSLRFSVKSFMYSGLIMGIYALFYYGFDGIINSLNNNQRIGQEINQTNIFGIYNTITFIICVSYGFFYNKKYYYLISVLPLFLSLTTASRKVIINLIVGLTVLIIHKTNSKKIMNFIISLIFIIILFNILTSIDIFNNTFRRFDNLLNFFKSSGELADNSLLTRFSMIRFGWERFLENPILGYGTKQYDELYFQYFGLYRYAHNVFIQILVDYGIIGTISFFGMYVYILINIFKNSRNSVMAITLISIVIMWLVTGIAFEYSKNKITYIILAWGFAYCNIFIELKNKKRMSKLKLRNKL